MWEGCDEESVGGLFGCVEHAVVSTADGRRVSGDDEDRFVELLSSLSRPLPLSVWVFACPNSTFRHLEAKLREHTVSLQNKERHKNRTNNTLVTRKGGMCIVDTDN